MESDSDMAAVVYFLSGIIFCANIAMLACRDIYNGDEKLLIERSRGVSEENFFYVTILLCKSMTQETSTPNSPILSTQSSIHAYMSLPFVVSTFAMIIVKTYTRTT
uniref:Uncharacterized protein n=1 Tax=Glossina brevipalpis TaxID=37001 RepID=A0A1A9X3E9_9MUSC